MDNVTDGVFLEQTEFLLARLFNEVNARGLSSELEIILQKLKVEYGT